MQSVTTLVPGTTANLGPGYDCLGIALGLSNRVTVVRLDPHETPTIPRHTPAQPAAQHMAQTAASLFFERSGTAPFPFDWKVEGEVPPSRGMGSSVTVRLGLLSGLNVLSGSCLNRQQLFELCAQLEGHPDNAAPAAFGGFTVASGTVTARFPVSAAVRFVLLIPDFEVSTPEARKVLPPHLERLSAVASCANACRITAAFASQNYELLRGAFEDGLHQPFRQPLIPFLTDVIRAGENAGALGGFLSGSGSTICCVTLQNADAIASAMQAAAGAVSCRTVVTWADNDGIRVLDPAR